MAGGMNTAVKAGFTTSMDTPMKIQHLASALLLALTATLTFAQQAGTAAAPAAAAASAPAWKFKTKHLSVAEIDALLAQPEKLLVLDVRRPDELIQYGSFPAFINIQNSEVEKYLAYLPKDRIIMTVSNHANRAGATGDLLSAKGYTVAGAAGSEDYEHEGGKAVRHIQPPAPRAPAAAASAAR